MGSERKERMKGEEGGEGKEREGEERGRKKEFIPNVH